ncbi:MAG: tetratricopeptide repeat protein, partial [Proteobacteria bacterium]|nr:tetratricopeptide repeat protein [Pseudomonadota bacterium]
MRDGKTSEAWRTCQELLKTAPDLEATRYLASKTALQIGNARLALEHADAALAVSDKAALHLQRAQCLLVLGDRDTTRSAINKVVSLAENDVAILVVAGAILNKCEDVVGALTIFRQAQQLEPENDSVLFNLATSLRFLGELDEAEEVINRVIEGCPDNHQSVLFRADLRKQTPDDNHIEDLESRIARGANDWKGEMNLFYALAKEAEDIGSYEKSFRALSRGSTVRRRHLDYDVLRDVAVLDDIREHYGEQKLCSGGDGFAADGPVFIVGMPRTGTTLVERMLAGHS